MTDETDHINMNKDTKYWYEKGIDDMAQIFIDMQPESVKDSMLPFCKSMKIQLKRQYDLLERVQKNEAGL